MKILHTSDWHIGRTFHQHSTALALGEVLDALVAAVVEHGVDLVVVAGDVFDSSTPSAPAVEELDRVLVALSRTGATVVITSGNHDSPARLGAKSAFTAELGVHLVTRPEDHEVPIVLHDEHGPVHVHGIPYLEPALVRHRWPEAAITDQASGMAFALDNVRRSLAEAGQPRSVVLAHTFVSGAEGESCESERSITVGGVDRVPVPAFDGITYAALGHVHGRNVLASGVRYSGAPLHLSFSEQDKPRGAWLVELDADGLGEVQWVPLPVPRRLVTLTGTLERLLEDPALDEHVADWVRVRLTDDARPLDPMARLSARFPGCVVLEHVPANPRPSAPRLRARELTVLDDDALVGRFLEHVRQGEGPDEAESALLADVISTVRAQEVSA